MTRTAQDNKVRRIVLTGLFSALIFVFTAYIHVPTGAGYTHAGDGFIYLAACILPTPYAVAAGMIGGALADGLTGFPVWIPATIVIKAVTALFFTSKRDKIINLRNILGILPSLAVCIVGYSIYEGVFMAGGFNKAAIIAAFGQTPFYAIQVFASSVLFIAAGLALDKSGLKKRI
ncbi:MAG: TIGR04002 family protein [Ruminococcus sp.]|nr:TIGR04002 family protein [Ruminococcus sp.]